MATKILPLLITRDIVVLPNTETQIEAGREKSVLIAELYLKDEKKHNEIVIATQIDGLVEDPIFKDIYKEATLCEITNVIKSPTNHAFTIIVKGISRVKLSSMDNEKTKYYSCNYGLTKELNVLGQTISPNIAELKKIINDENVVVNNDVRKKAIKMFDDSHDTIVLIDQLTHLFTNYDFVHNKKIRHDILSEQNFGKRIVILTNFIKIDSISDGMKKEIDNFVNKKVNETLSNQQKEYYLKEKIRVVKDELGKINPKENDISGYRNLLESNPYPENIRIKVESELAKIEGTGFSQENAISKAYIE
jgi:ATP-dependent Lon protease